MTDHGQKKRKFWHTGITKHAGKVALSPARLLTSYLRHWFHGKYKGQYRLAKMVFGFDLFLAAMALCLLIFNITLIVQSSHFGDSGLDLTFIAKPLKASDASPLQIVIRAKDGQTHRDVSLRWNLPEWVEILRSEPRLNAENSIFLGTLKPGEEKVSTIYVRFRASKGTKVPISFMLHQFDALGFFRDQKGYEVRTIEEISLSADPAVQARYFSHNATLLPILVHNKSSLTAEAVTMELLSEPDLSKVHFLSDQDTTSDGQMVLGDIEPGGKKVAYVVLPNDQETVRLKWNLLERSHVVYQNYIRYDATTGTVIWSPDDVELKTDGEKLTLINNAKRSGLVFLDHPGLSERNLITLLLSPTTTENSVMLENAAATSSRRWTSIIVQDSDGGIIGPVSGGYLNSSLPLETRARYYTDLGDQVGIGPIPPQAGVTTTFWVVWSLGPLEYGLSNVRLETVLPEGVTATGRNSSEYSGDFSFQGRKVSWFFPEDIPASPGAPINLSFEISFMPTSDMVGKIAPLVGETKVSGKDSVFGGELKSEKIPGDDTRLESDPRAKNSGLIQPE
ncbi:MAG: hypothetical protein ABIB04_00735 [Patescibacteria group bacterium]